MVPCKAFQELIFEEPLITWATRELLEMSHEPHTIFGHATTPGVI